MISLCITHRVDEDISWVEDLYADLIIYNKGKNWDLPYPCIKAPKIKNETDTYIRGIIDNYQNLHQYRTIFFLKPNCVDYKKDVISELSVTQYNQIKDHEIVFLSEPILMFDFNIMVANSKNDPVNSELNSLIVNILFDMSKNLSINLDDSPYPISPGSQYRVPTFYILSKPKKWWVLLQSYYFKLYDLVGDHVSHIFEFLWPKIFIHNHQ